MKLNIASVVLTTTTLLNSNTITIHAFSPLKHLHFQPKTKSILLHKALYSSNNNSNSNRNSNNPQPEFEGQQQVPQGMSNEEALRNELRKKSTLVDPIDELTYAADISNTSAKTAVSTSASAVKGMQSTTSNLLSSSAAVPTQPSPPSVVTTMNKMDTSATSATPSSSSSPPPNLATESFVDGNVQTRIDPQPQSISTTPQFEQPEPTGVTQQESILNTPEPETEPIPESETEPEAIVENVEPVMEEKNVEPEVKEEIEVESSLSTTTTTTATKEDLDEEISALVDEVNKLTNEVSDKIKMEKTKLISSSMKKKKEKVEGTKKNEANIGDNVEGEEKETNNDTVLNSDTAMTPVLATESVDGNTSVTTTTQPTGLNGNVPTTATEVVVEPKVGETKVEDKVATPVEEQEMKAEETAQTSLETNGESTSIQAVVEEDSSSSSSTKTTEQQLEKEREKITSLTQTRLDRILKPRPYPLFLAEKAALLSGDFYKSIQGNTKRFTDEPAYELYRQQVYGITKEKIVILGTGWGSAAFLKDIDTNMYDVTVISPRNYFLFTPM